MKKITAAAGALLLVLGIYAGVKLTSGISLEKALKQYEKGRYAASIENLNSLAASADYEELEKIFYYRVKAANRLAASLEKKYSTELKMAVAENRNRPDFDKAVNKINAGISEINESINGDLRLSIELKKSRITTGGGFYNEFTGRFRGSPYIEDLHFEELEKINRTEPFRFIEAAASFHSRHPDSPYLPRIVSMVMDSMRQGTATLTGSGDEILNMITLYAARYPTSPGISRILVCEGDNVNLRNSPGTGTGLTGTLARGTVLIQLERSMDTMQIGDVRDYWYRVTSVTGQTGWVFGQFVRPIDTSKYKAAAEKSIWTIVENFENWSDSNTPEDWIHVDGADPSTISFTGRGDKKIAVLNSLKNSKSGIFMRQGETRDFSITANARFIAGDSVFITVRNIDGKNIFYVKIGPGSVESCGRIIPFDTLGWREYTITSDDGRYARLYIDGELISGKIEPVSLEIFKNRGIYTLFTPEGKSALCEIDYIKIK